MAGQLQGYGDGGGIIPCSNCGADAAGPCARCRKPVCGNCCVLVEQSASPWAICLTCNRRGGRSLRPGWVAAGLWLLVPIAALAVILILLNLVF